MKVEFLGSDTKKGKRRARARSRARKELCKMSTLLFITVELFSEYHFDCHWIFGLNVTWCPEIYPTVQIVPLKGAFWNLKTKSGNVRVTLPVTYSYNDCYSVVLKPTMSAGKMDERLQRHRAGSLWVYPETATIFGVSNSI